MRTTRQLAKTYDTFPAAKSVHNRISMNVLRYTHTDLRKEKIPTGREIRNHIKEMNTRIIVSKPQKGGRSFYVQHHGHSHRMPFLLRKA